MEKDHHTATVQSSGAFIVAVNHDEAQEGSVESCIPKEQAVSQNLQATGRQDLAEDGVESKNASLNGNDAEEKSPGLGIQQNRISLIPYKRLVCKILSGTALSARTWP